MEPLNHSHPSHENVALSSDMEVIFRQKLYLNIFNTSKFPVVSGFQIILYTTKFFCCHWELIIPTENSLFYIKSLVEFFEQHSITTCTSLSVLNPSEYMGFPGGPRTHLLVQEMWDVGSILGLGRSPGGGHGNPLQYSCLENPVDWGAWRATVYRVTKIWTQLKWMSMHFWIQIPASSWLSFM